MSVRRIVFVILIILFALFLFKHVAQASEFWAVLRRGQIFWLVAATALETAAMLNQTALYQSLYGAVGVRVRWRDLLPVVLAGHFVNVVTPAAGLGGTALLLDDARRRGLDTGRVSLANTLYFGFNFAWFAMLLIYGIAMLARWHDLKPYELIPAAVMVGGVMLAFCGLLLVAARPFAFVSLTNWVVARTNVAGKRLVHRELLSPASAANFGQEFAAASAVLHSGKARLLRPWLHTLFVDGLAIAVLGACFAAFPSAAGTAQGPQMAPSLLIAGYSVGTLFLVLSVTPQGIGVVEGVMTVLFVSLGVPVERAAIVVVAYRGLALWVPLLAGFICLTRTPSLRLATNRARGAGSVPQEAVGAEPRNLLETVEPASLTNS